MKGAVIVWLGLAACAWAIPVSPKEDVFDVIWKMFKDKYVKVYNTIEDEAIRRAIFNENIMEVQKHNLEYDLGMHTYTLGMNEFSDMTVEEFDEQMNGLRPPTAADNTPPASVHSYEGPVSDLPAEVDWTKKGFVTPIKNQRSCGSCYAFSATGALEGQMFNKTGKLVSLSEQNIVDCSEPEGNHGCFGGYMDHAFKYVKINKGIDTEAAYPYVAKTQNCSYNASAIGGEDVGLVDIESGSEVSLQHAVATVGPVSIGINARGYKFKAYKSGIFSKWWCPRTKSWLDHGVLAVGYGTSNGKDYWLVKNSWGQRWGMNGYIKMARNKHNMCGIATMASYPIV